MLRPLLALVLALALLPAARAQGTIATDRPGLAFSPLVVPTGAFQVELGLPQLTRAGGSATLLNAPAAVRVGVAPRLELRAGSTLLNRLSVDDADASTGFGDVEIGAKYQVLTGGPGLPTLAVIPAVVLPVGGDGFTAGDPVVTATAVAGFALPSGFGLTLVGGASVPTAEGADPNAALVALVGRSFTPALSGYVEAGVFPSEAATPAFAGAGLAVLVSPRVQLDAFFDAGLTDDAPDVVAGIGLSARFGR